MGTLFDSKDCYVAAFNIEKNSSWLKDVLWEQYLDFAIVPYLKRENGIIPIKKGFLEQLGVTEEYIFNKAKRNTFYPDNIRVLNPAKEDPFDMYIITNKDCLFGAAMIANKIMMKVFADEIIGEDFWVIPSSVHECILLPNMDGFWTGDEVLEMVYEKNQEIEEGIFLADSVYYYNKERKELKKYEAAR